jgi:hypothetical protein
MGEKSEKGKDLLDWEDLFGQGHLFDHGPSEGSIMDLSDDEDTNMNDSGHDGNANHVFSSEDFFLYVPSDFLPMHHPSDEDMGDSGNNGNDNHTVLDDERCQYSFFYFFDLNAWLQGSFVWPSNDAAQLFWDNLSLHLNQWMIAHNTFNTYSQRVRDCLKDNLPALFVLSDLVNFRKGMMPGASLYAKLSGKLMEFDIDSGWRFRIDSNVLSENSECTREFIAFCVEFVRAQNNHPSILCSRALRWILSAPWYRVYPRLNIFENDIFGMSVGIDIPTFFEEMFSQCEYAQNNGGSDADHIHFTRFVYELRKSKKCLKVIRDVPLQIGYNFKIESAEAMCLYCCFSAIPGAALPLTIKNTDEQQKWGFLLGELNEGTMYAVGFNPVLREGKLRADIQFYGPSQPVNFLTDIPEVFTWLSYPLPPESSSLLQVDTRWLKSPTDVEKSSLHASVEEASEYGFQTDTILEVAQCKAVQFCLQPKGPSHLDYIVLASAIDVIPRIIEPGNLATLPVTTDVIVRERHKPPNGMFMSLRKRCKHSQDDRFEHKVDNLNMTVTISPVKLGDLRVALAAERNCLRMLLKMPTGSGKTLVALTLLCHTLGEKGLQNDKPVVVMVPSVMLALQMVSSIKRFTKLDALLLADKDVSKDKTHSLDAHIKKDDITGTAVLEHLTQLKKVLVIVNGKVCSRVLQEDASSMRPWFLILDEIQDLISIPRRSTFKEKNMRMLINHEIESTHMLVLSSTPEAVLKSIRTLLSPLKVMAPRILPEIQQAFLDRHTFTQVTPSRRAFQWTQKCIVTSMEPLRKLYTQLRDEHKNFLSREHDTDNLSLVLAILHRCGQQIDAVLRENLRKLIDQLLKEPKRDRKQPKSSSKKIFAAGSEGLNAWLKALWSGSSPKLKYSTGPPHVSSTSELQCPICMEPLGGDGKCLDQIVQMPCTHLVCVRCFSEWAKVQYEAKQTAPRCPLDNQPVNDVSHPTTQHLGRSFQSGVGNVQVSSSKPVKVQANKPTLKENVKMALDKKSVKRTRNPRSSIRTSDLVIPFSNHSKTSALLETLNNFPGRRIVLFCFPEELDDYELLMQQASLTTTQSVAVFQQNVNTNVILLPHAEGSGANLDGATLLIRIGIDSTDPGQAIRQRGRLMRLSSQRHDLVEVVIVSPGWEYMLLKLQAQNEATGLETYVQLGKGQLCMNLMYRLQFGHQLGLQTKSNVEALPLDQESGRSLSPLLKLISALALQIDQDVLLLFDIYDSVSIHQHPSRCGSTQNEDFKLIYNFKTKKFHLSRREKRALRPFNDCNALIQWTIKNCSHVCDEEPTTPSPSFCCLQARSWFIMHCLPPLV